MRNKSHSTWAVQFPLKLSCRPDRLPKRHPILACFLGTHYSVLGTRWEVQGTWTKYNIQWYIRTSCIRLYCAYCTYYIYCTYCSYCCAFCTSCTYCAYCTYVRIHTPALVFLMIHRKQVIWICCATLPCGVGLGPFWCYRWQLQVLDFHILSTLGFVLENGGCILAHACIMEAYGCIWSHADAWRIHINT